jgi:hypothetical protein
MGGYVLGIGNVTGVSLQNHQHFDALLFLMERLTPMLLRNIICTQTSRVVRVI